MNCGSEEIMKNDIKQDNLKIIRFGIPSKGRMEKETLKFLYESGFNLERNKRQYIAKLENFPQIQLVFQRQRDIISGILSGSLTFGITGFDLLKEVSFNKSEKFVIIHDALGFGKCNLELAIPEEWSGNTISSLKTWKKKIRVATKFPNLTKQFLEKQNIPFKLIDAAGTIEVTPALDYADIIVDLVSTGQTLTDNRLKRLSDGCILNSQAIFIGNRQALLDRETLEIAKIFLEYFEGALRAKNFVSVFANMKGKSAQEIGNRVFSKKGLGGLQGPTVSPIISPNGNTWYAIHIIVEKAKLTQTLTELRSIGGSGVVISPTMFIFEEQPLNYKKMLKQLEVVQ